MGQTARQPPDGGESPPSNDFDSALLYVSRRFEVARAKGAPLRDEIAASWQRSAINGLQPRRLQVPYDPEIDKTSRLAWAADPIVRQVADDLDRERVGLILADQHGHVIGREAREGATLRLLDRIELAPGFVYAEAAVGTNAIGTALAQRAPSRVLGPEHYADALVTMACAAVPIMDPTTGRVLGAIDLTTTAKDASPLMLPLMRRAAWEVEQRLFDGPSVEEHVLREHFLRARRQAKGPLVAVSKRSLMVNGASSGIVASSDHAMLWEWVQSAIHSRLRDTPELNFSGGTVWATSCEPVLEGARVIGAVVTFSARSRMIQLVSDGPVGARLLGLGLEALTDTENALAKLVTQGMTNREAAAHMFLSPHTIDFHLRKMYQKLGVRSRVELTRALLERTSRTG